MNSLRQYSPIEETYVVDITRYVSFYFLGLILGTLVERFKPRVSNRYMQLFVTSTINAVVLLSLLTFFSEFTKTIQRDIGGVLFITMYFAPQNLLIPIELI